MNVIDNGSRNAESKASMWPEDGDGGRARSASLQMLVRAAVIAAVYVALCWLLAPISFGIVQFRVAEALTVLPILYPEAVPALYVGVMLANIIGGYGPWDIFGGSAVTLLAAIVTYRYRRSIVAYLSPVVLNAFLVSAYLAPMLGWPYWLAVLSVGAGEAGVVFLLGRPLIYALERAGAGKK